jgi:hypothetical protein
MLPIMVGLSVSSHDWIEPQMIPLTAGSNGLNWRLNNLILTLWLDSLTFVLWLNDLILTLCLSTKSLPVMVRSNGSRLNAHELWLEWENGKLNTHGSNGSNEFYNKL